MGLKPTRSGFNQSGLAQGQHQAHMPLSQAFINAIFFLQCLWVIALFCASHFNEGYSVALLHNIFEVE